MRASKFIKEVYEVISKRKHQALLSAKLNLAITELEELDKKISSIIKLSMLHDTDDVGNSNFRNSVEDILSGISND